jgi:hypothetical protein
MPRNGAGLRAASGLGHHVRRSRRRIDPGISPFDVI